MRFLLCLMLAMCMLAASVQAQEDGAGGYTDLEFDAGAISGSFGDVMRLETFSGGVKIILTSQDPSLKPLPIQAETMEFQYGEGSEKPALIVMTGGVYIEHPRATVRAGRARWDFNTGELVFTGNPVMNSDRFKELKGEEMVINFKTNAFSVKKGTATEVPFNTGDMVAVDTSLLSASDIANWAGLIDAMKNAASSNTPSPSLQLVNQLDAGVKNMLLNTPTANLVEMQNDVVKQLNAVIKKPGLYSKEAFSGIALNEEVNALLAKGDLQAEEQSRQNRLLFNAAFAQFLAP